MGKLDKRAEERRSKFRVWPEPRRKKYASNGKTVLNYGPTLKQKFLFLDKILSLTTEEISKSLLIPLQEWNRKFGYTENQIRIQETAIFPHLHPVDVFLFDGGNRCHAKGTELILYDGSFKKVEDLKVGDLLMGPDSLPRRVLSTAHGRETMYKISPLKGKPFICNESHILSLKKVKLNPEIRINKDGSTYIKPIRYPKEDIWNVTIKDYLNSSHKRKNFFKLWRPERIDFDSTSNLDIDPYILGLWLGDGYSNRFALTTMDVEIDQAFCSYITKQFPNLEIKKDFFPDKKSWNIKISCPALKSPTKLLRKLNLYKNKHIPLVYKTSSYENRLQLLAGLLDTDGHLANGTYFEITQKRKDLAEDIVFLAKSLGFSANIFEVKKHCTYKGEKREGTYYRIHICGDIPKIPTRLPRKQAVKGGIEKSNHLLTGFTIEKLEEDDYYGVSIDGDHLYLLSDFTVSHNSGKSVAAVARVMQFLLENPGTTAVVGAENMPLLKRTAWEYWRQRLTIFQDWDHPLVAKKPSQHESRLRLTNGSQVWFIHFSDYRVLRGIEADIIHIEEASLLPDENSMNELIRRLSGKAKLRQLILTTNPEEDHGWIYTKFNLKQFEIDYEGEPLPIGDKCNCHYCQECLDQQEIKIPWVNKRCPECGSKKDNDCPGNQQFFRVLRIASFENYEHLPSEFTQSAKSGMSEEYFRHYIKGQVGELRTGRVYKSYSKSKNISTETLPFNPDLPLYWSLDFNISYQCSVVCQEYYDDDGPILIVVDELVLPQAGPEDVAREFLNRFGQYKVPILMYGDPTAHNNKISPNDISQFKLIAQILDDPRKYGIDLDPKECSIMTPKERSNVVGKVDSTNAMLLNSDGLPRVLINPHCEWIQAGLGKVKWKEDTPGRSVIDDQCDKNAAKAADKSTVRPLTHICDALAYLIYKRHPATPDLNQNPFLQAPGGSIIEKTNLGTVEYSLLPEEEEENKNTGSFWDIIENEGGWEHPEDEDFGFFGHNNFWQ